jgi:hypothetical protein
MFSKDLLSSEKRLSNWVNSTFVGVLVTGILCFALDIHNTFSQLNSLLHIGIGFAFSFIITPYFFVHFKRTLTFRRAHLIFSGLCLLLAFIIILYTGMYISYFGLTESTRFLLALHLYGAVAFVVILLTHILSHSVLFPKHRLKVQHNKFASYTHGNGKLVAIFNAYVAVFIALVILVIELGEQEDNPTSAAIQPYTYDYGVHKFRPAQTETYDGNFQHYRDIADSQKCLNCHQEIGKEWLSSMHRLAAADPTYVTNIELLTANKGMAAARYCEGCHAPVALLTGQLTEGGFHGGTANTIAHAEGMSCMSCHGIQDLKHEKGNGSYIFKPMTDYLFGNSQNKLLSWLNSRLIKINPQQHRRDMANPLMQEPKICSSCHSQFMDVAMNNWGWVKMQDDFSAWVDSPYAQHHDIEFSTQDYTRCQDCHMPLVPSHDPSANSDGKARSHRFIAANTFVPKMRGDDTQFELTKAFLQSNKMRVVIDKPTRSDAFHSQFHIDESLRNMQETPFFYYLGETATIQIVVTNVGVGHNFPAGTIDINQAWIDFNVKDAHGVDIYSSGFIDENDYVDPTAYFYGSTPVDRNGEHVWKHDLFNMVGESFKRVIPSGDSDIVEYSFLIPAWAETPLTVHASLKYRKLNTKYARWALKEQYFSLPVIEMAWDSLQVPLKIKPRVIDKMTSQTE